MNSARTWTAALLVIGDEILSGRTQDKNVAQVATWLNEQGIRLGEVRIVPDDIDRIADNVNALRSVHDYLFTTGGIGPTHDDITVDAMARPSACRQSSIRRRARSSRIITVTGRAGSPRRGCGWRVCPKAPS